MIEAPTFGGSPDNTHAPVVVFAHVFYPDIWESMSTLLAARLTVPFHLVVTSPHPEHDIAVPSTPALLSTRYVGLENRGRDILPFLRALAITDGFEIGLKLHTKKSPQRDDGADWRAAILESLLPPAAGAEAIVAHMRADPRIGFVAPGDFCLSVRPWILVNAPGITRIVAELGRDPAADQTLEQTFDPADESLDDVFFAAGSMFWFRRSALAALPHREVMALFEAEQGQLDGTIAHAMERVFPLEARRQGFLSLAVPALMESRPDMSRSALLAIAREHADVPNRHFPGPNGLSVPVSETWAALPATGPKPLLAAIYRASLPIGLRRALRRLLRR